MAEPLNICVVDDDRDVAEGLAEILELSGHRVRTAFTGQDALSILDAADCDIAFINATLPDLTTLESFMAIRKAKPGLKAVMMTGYTVEQLLKQTVRDGSVSVLQKPVTMDEVVRTLEGAKPKGIVLVAEDAPAIGTKIGDTLRLQNHRVGVARTAEDALDMVFADRCDVLILDLREPVICALEVYLDLEKQDRALPTIVISDIPDQDSGQIDLLRNPAVTGVLVKPFDPARLVASLDTVHKPASPPPAEEQVEKVDQPAGHGGRILVIDDDRDLAEGLGDILRDLGHTVEIAFTSSEALEIARRFDAQVALVDIKLGRTSGLELIGSLKELRPGIVNVVITANAGKESVIASLRSGAFDFLNKPMHPQDLFAILDRCFEQIRTQEAKNRGPDEQTPEFVANVSHELRDPLNAVIGFSEILGDEMLGPLGSEQYVHYARGINEAGHHLTTVIDDMIEHKPPAAEGAQDDSPEGAESHAATSGEDVTPGPPDENDAEFGELPAFAADMEGHPSDRGEDVSEVSSEPAPDQPSEVEPEPAAPGPNEPEPAAPQPQRAWWDQLDAATPAPDESMAPQVGADEAQPEAAWPEPEREAAASVPVDPRAPLFSGTIWGSDRPISAEPPQPRSEDDEGTPDFGSDPWPTPADPGMAEFGPAATEQPEPDWPDPGQAEPPDTGPPQYRAPESSPGEPAWSESAWQAPHPAEAPPVEHDAPWTGWDEPPFDDFAAAPPGAGQPQPGDGQAVAEDAEQEEPEDEEEALGDRDPMHQDQEAEGREDKIVKLSPFRKVI